MPDPATTDRITDEAADRERSRAPITAAAVAATITETAPTATGRWTVTSVAATGSTNDDLAAAARAGAPGGQVLIAELQEAGKGRRGRTWTAPFGSGLTMSVLLELPEVPVARRSWVSAIAGLCLVEAVRAESSVPAGLKWPNDLLVADRKCAGLLAEATADGVVLGMGLNVSLTADELPRPDATSLQLAGAPSLDRTALAAAVLDALARWITRWRAAAGDPDRSGLRAAYRDVCVTLGQPVRVELPSGEHVVGTARDVTEDGALIVDTRHGSRSFAAADVHHLRAT